MSNSVVVFSTYYNHPVFPDKLFNRKDSEQPQIGLFLKEFFMNRLMKDSSMWSTFADYLYLESCPKHSLKQTIVFDQNDEIKKIEKQIQENIPFVNQYLEDKEKVAIDIDIDSADFECWIDDLKDSENKHFNEIKQLYESWKSLQKTDDYLKNYIEKNKINFNDYVISNEGEQEVFDIYCSSANIPKEQPWLYNRVSFYKLKDTCEQTSIYAVWPLKESSLPLNNDWEEVKRINCEWIECLTKQFLILNNDCNTLYLCLHAKDIFGSNSSTTVSYELFGPNQVPFKEKQINIVVLLFQHPITAIRNILSQREISSNEILESIKKEVLKMGLNQIRQTVSTDTIQKIEYDLQFYKNLHLYEEKIDKSIDILKAYKECCNEDEKYSLRKEFKTIINDIVDF